MDFFSVQDRSHRNTRLAIWLFAAAVIAIVATVVFVVATIDYNLASYPESVGLPGWDWFFSNPQKIAFSALATAGLILIGSVYQISVLNDGGGVVARSMGGVQVKPDTQNLDEKKLLNIVTEMSIASGVPLPGVYVLPDERGINAFAAGFTPASAAVGVTRGCIEQLTRDELQGVIAHEFSHILNGDMRLNIRLMGVLHGILLIALTGQMLLRNLTFSRAGRSDRRASGVLMGGYMIGFALMVVGYIGVFFSRIIQAVVSRQREFLADASAVQFTRNPDGIAGALKKIAGIKLGSKIRHPQAEEISHMLFGQFRTSWFDLFATHPPILQRIQAIDPRFKPEDHQVPQSRRADASGDAPVSGISELVGNPEPQHLEFAQGLLASLPESIQSALTDPKLAEALILAVAIHPDPNVRQSQVDGMKGNLENTQIHKAAELYRELKPLGPTARLPILDLAVGTLRSTDVERARALVDQVHDMAWADGTLSTFEFALVALLRSHFKDVFETPNRPGRAKLSQRLDDIVQIFAILARTGCQDDAGARQAYDAGMMALFGSSWPDFPAEGIRNITDLEAVLDGLDGLRSSAKRQLVNALRSVVAFDHKILLEEYELLRAICETIHCPLPPGSIDLEEIHG